MVKKIMYDENVLIWIIIGLLGILILFLFFPVSFDDKIVSVEIIVIEGCENCFDMNSIVEGFESQQNLKIKNIEKINYQTKEGISLIEKYGVKKIPAFILKSRDLEKIDTTSIEKSGALVKKDYLVFERGAPYIDLSSNNIQGLIEVIEIQDDSCIECGTFSSVIKNLETSGVKTKSYEIIDSDSVRAQELITQNKITFFPALLISKELKEYWWIIESINSRVVEYEDYYAIVSPIYPYKDIMSGKIKGIVKAKYLVNDSCEDCLEISGLGESFKKIGVYIDEENNVDISSAEGKNIISKYNITTIPTVIFSKEISDYKEMLDLFKQVGTIEKDGSFVFRKIKEVGKGYQEI